MKKNFPVVGFHYCELEGDIDDVINRLQERRAATDNKLSIEIETTYEYGDSYVSATLYENREETDKERTKREENERIDKAQRDEWDRKQFEALKKKFKE